MQRVITIGRSWRAMGDASDDSDDGTTDDSDDGTTDDSDDSDDGSNADDSDDGTTDDSDDSDDGSNADDSGGSALVSPSASLPQLSSSATPAIAWGPLCLLAVGAVALGFGAVYLSKGCDQMNNVTMLRRRRMSDVTLSDDGSGDDGSGDDGGTPIDPSAFAATDTLDPSTDPGATTDPTSPDFVPGDTLTGPQGSTAYTLGPAGGATARNSQNMTPSAPASPTPTPPAGVKPATPGAATQGRQSPACSSRCFSSVGPGTSSTESFGLGRPSGTRARGGSTTRGAREDDEARQPRAPRAGATQHGGVDGRARRGDVARHALALGSDCRRIIGSVGYSERARDRASGRRRRWKGHRSRRNRRGSGRPRCTRLHARPGAPPWRQGGRSSDGLTCARVRRTVTIRGSRATNPGAGLSPPLCARHAKHLPQARERWPRAARSSIAKRRQRTPAQRQRTVNWPGGTAIRERSRRGALPTAGARAPRSIAVARTRGSPLAPGRASLAAPPTDIDQEKRRCAPRVGAAT